MNDKRQPNEKVYQATPQVIKYICEHCGIGEMKYQPEEVKIETLQLGGLRLHQHQCSICHLTLQLPKVYPYIDWVVGDEIIEEKKDE